LSAVPFVIYVDKLYRVDDDRHVTEGFSDADEGYQMKDAAGRLHFVVLLTCFDTFYNTKSLHFARYLATRDIIFILPGHL